VKIGWVSVSPWAKTGYGRVTRDVVSRLLEKHEVTCIGHESDVIVWGGKKELALPNGKVVTTLVMRNPLVDQAGATDMVRVYAHKYGFDILIGLWDLFALGFMKGIGTPFVDYVPVDGPMTQKWFNYTEGAQKIVAYSRFGFDELSKFAAPSRLGYVPHGVDCRAFRPLGRDKKELREMISAKANKPVPKDAFLFINTAANYGARKHLPLMLRTFASFVRKHPSHLYLHTNVHIDAPNGYDLPTLINSLGISENVSYPTYDPIIEPVEDEEFAQLYNAGDAYITDSVGEGFGMPVLEAMACGIPAIAPNNTSMPELVGDHGWLVDNVPEDVYMDYPIYVPTLQANPVPDQRRMYAAMQEAMENILLREEYGRKSREFALTYDWGKTMPKWFSMLDDVAEDIELRHEIREVFKQ